MQGRAQARQGVHRALVEPLDASRKTRFAHQLSVLQGACEVQLKTGLVFGRNPNPRGIDLLGRLKMGRFAHHIAGLQLGQAWRKIDGLGTGFFNRQDGHIPLIFVHSAGHLTRLIEHHKLQWHTESERQFLQNVHAHPRQSARGIAVGEQGVAQVHARPQ